MLAPPGTALPGVALEPAPPAPPPAPPAPAVELDDDDDMEPWEMYRNDLRYDNNDDGKVDEDDFPNWRNPGQ